MASLYGDETMLILSRKVGEEIVIGDSVLIRVVKSSGNRVTLAVEAPKDVSIMRSELSPDSRASREQLPPAN